MSVWFGTSHTSGCQDSVSTQWTCQKTHLLLSSREGLGVLDQLESSLLPLLAKGIPSPVKNSWTLKSSVGRGSKLSGSGCDQSEYLPHTISSTQDSRWESSAPMLGLSLNVTPCLEYDGLGTGLSGWYGIKTPGVPYYTYLQPWTISIGSSPITYGYLIADGSPITDYHSWWNNSTFRSYPPGELWLPMSTFGHLMLLPGPLCMTPPLDPWSGHRWHRPSAGTQTGGLAWKFQWVLLLAPPLAGHIPTYAGGTP